MDTLIPKTEQKDSVSSRNRIFQSVDPAYGSIFLLCPTGSFIQGCRVSSYFRRKITRVIKAHTLFSIVWSEPYRMSDCSCRDMGSEVAQIYPCAFWGCFGLVCLRTGCMHCVKQTSDLPTTYFTLNWAPRYGRPVSLRPFLEAFPPPPFFWVSSSFPNRIDGWDILCKHFEPVVPSWLLHMTLNNGFRGSGKYYYDDLREVWASKWMKYDRMHFISFEPVVPSWLWGLFHFYYIPSQTNAWGWDITSPVVCATNT
jgi:hypothetical protein